MALSFARQAQNTFNPVFAQKTKALQAQIPAIQQLYNALSMGLNREAAAGTQNILENASGRGLLYSTIPVDAQTSLAQDTLQKQGQLGAEQAKDMAGVQSDIADTGISQASAISGLINALRGQDLQQRQYNWDRAVDNRGYNLDRRIADRQYALDKKRLAMRY